MKHTHKAKGPMFNMAHYEPTEINTMMRAKMMEGAVPRGACDQGIVDIAKAKDMKELYQKQGDWVLEKTPFKEILIMDMAAAQPQWFLEKVLGLWLALHGKEQYSPKWWIDAGIKIIEKPVEEAYFQVRDNTGFKYGEPHDSIGKAIELARKGARLTPGRVMVITQALRTFVATAREAKKATRLAGRHFDMITDELLAFPDASSITERLLARSMTMRQMPQSEQERFRRDFMNQPPDPIEIRRDARTKRIVWEGRDPMGLMERVATILNQGEVVRYDVAFDRPMDETTLTLRLRRQ